MPRQPRGGSNGRPKGARDKSKRKFNPNSGQNGNGNFYKLPLHCSTLVTYDPVVRHDTRKKTTESEALPEHVKRITRYIEKRYGLKPESEVTWEVGPKTGRVHAHWFMYKHVTTKAELDALFKAPAKAPQFQTSMKWLMQIGMDTNGYKKGTFTTWKHRFFQTLKYKTDDYVHKCPMRWNQTLYKGGGTPLPAIP